MRRRPVRTFWIRGNNLSTAGLPMSDCPARSIAVLNICCFITRVFMSVDGDLVSSWTEWNEQNKTQFVASQNETVIVDVCGYRTLNFSCTVRLRVLHTKNRKAFQIWSSKFKSGFFLFFLGGGGFVSKTPSWPGPPHCQDFTFTLT